MLRSHLLDKLTLFFLNAYYILGTVPDPAIKMVMERVWDGKTGRTINRPHW